MAAPRNPAKKHSRHGASRGTVGSRNPLVDLPAAGCDLPVPDLPPGRDWSERECARWEEL